MKEFTRKVIAEIEEYMEPLNGRKIKYTAASYVDLESGQHLHVYPAEINADDDIARNTFLTHFTVLQKGEEKLLSLQLVYKDEDDCILAIGVKKRADDIDADDVVDAIEALYVAFSQID
jgi:hypothetical protein